MTQKYDLELKQKRRCNNTLDDVACDDGFEDLFYYNNCCNCCVKW